MQKGVNMNFFNMKLNILVFAAFLALNPVEISSAQSNSSHKKSESSRTRTYNLYDNSSNSTLSEASNHRYDRKSHRDENILDEYRKNKHSRRNEYVEEKHRPIDRKRNTNRTTKKHFDKKTDTENYFHVDRSGRTLWDGKHWEINDYPLKIYVKESSSKYYKSEYKNYVKYALNVWRKADDRINYIFVDSRRDADISLYFIEDLGAMYEENYLGLTEYDMNRGKLIDYSKIQISLIKFGNEKVSDGEIKATVIHELGHAIGLGHSDNEYDIMYPFISPEHTASMNFDELSIGDKAAIEDVINLGDEEIYVRK
jgi:predicted Zn-dependent protease